MTTLDKRIYDGNRAKEVLQNEAFIAVFADMKQELVDQLVNSPYRDKEGREGLYNLIKLSDKLKSILVTSLETGKLANIEIEHKNKTLEKIKQLTSWA